MDERSGGEQSIYGSLSGNPDTERQLGVQQRLLRLEEALAALADAVASIGPSAPPDQAAIRANTGETASRQSASETASAKSRVNGLPPVSELHQIAPRVDTADVNSHWMPNQVLASDPWPWNSGGGGRKPSRRYIRPIDIDALEHRAGRQFSRFLPDILYDGGTSFEWFVNRPDPWDNSGNINHAADEDCLIFDRPSYYFSSAVPMASFNGKVIRAMSSGGRDGRVTFYVTDPSSSLLNFANAHDIRMEGHFSIEYLEPALNKTTAVRMFNSQRISIDSLSIKGSACGFSVDGVSEDIEIRKLEIVSPSGSDGARLFAGTRLKIDHLIINESAGDGLDVFAGWDGDFSIGRLEITSSQHHGLNYRGRGALDVIHEARISNNGLARPNHYHGISVSGPAENLLVQAGVIGEGREHKRAKGTISLGRAPSVGDVLWVNGVSVEVVHVHHKKSRYQLVRSESAEETVRMLFDILSSSDDDRLSCAFYQRIGSTIYISHNTIGAIGNSYSLKGLGEAWRLSGASLVGGNGTPTHRKGINCVDARKRNIVSYARLQGNFSGNDKCARSNMMSSWLVKMNPLALLRLLRRKRAVQSVFFFLSVMSAAYLQEL